MADHEPMAGVQPLDVQIAYPSADVGLDGVADVPVAGRHDDLHGYVDYGWLGPATARTPDEQVRPVQVQAVPEVGPCHPCAAARPIARGEAAEEAEANGKINRSRQDEPRNVGG